MSSGSIRAGKASVELSMDSSKLAAGISRAQRELAAFGRSVGKAGAGISGFGAGILGSFVPLVGMAAREADAINRFKIAFGDLAGVAEEFAETYAKSIGRSPDGIRDALTQFQSLFEVLGANEEAALDLAKAATGAAYDFAALSGIATSDAVDAFGKALLGSAKSLGKFSKVATGARLDAALIGHGFADGATGAEDLHKAIARLEIILGAMTESGVMGQAIERSEAYTQQLELLKEQLEDTGEAIGAGVLPAFSQFLSLLNPAIEAIGNFAAATPSVTLAVAGTAAGMVVLGTALTSVGLAALGASAAMSTFVTVLGAASAFLGVPASIVGGFVAAGLALTDVVEDAKLAFSDLASSASLAFGGIASAIKAGDFLTAGKIAGQAFHIGLQTIWEVIRSAWEDFWMSVITPIKEVGAFLTSLLINVGQAVLHVAGLVVDTEALIASLEAFEQDVVAEPQARRRQIQDEQALRQAKLQQERDKLRKLIESLDNKDDKSQGAISGGHPGPAKVSEKAALFFDDTVGRQPGTQGLPRLKDIADISGRSAIQRLFERDHDDMRDLLAETKLQTKIEESQLKAIREASPKFR